MEGGARTLLNPERSRAISQKASIFEVGEASTEKWDLLAGQISRFAKKYRRQTK
jgi:hypothetical protein